MERKVFRSRVSVLLAGLILEVSRPHLILMFHQKPYLGTYVVGGIFLLAILSLFSIRYIISENKLFLKVYWIIPSGSVNVADIISIKRSYIQSSFPAASLKRLRICSMTDKGLAGSYFLVSPVREQEFCDALKTMNPDIHISVNDKKAWYRIWDWDI